ncbi:hypothetical protein OS493_000004 [Desmophyllum pertusum]|uniref:Uncharacterized protein n=1 Tax=Desmophyllum pertusum TaxID=174260 RepID=A0A9X0A6F8_9CNID|nr:hypothetical protein OS493_000004 [Desmophyllum pertusum]
MLASGLVTLHHHRLYTTILRLPWQDVMSFLAHSQFPAKNWETRIGGYVNGYFEAIPPTTTVDENGFKQSIGINHQSFNVSRSFKEWKFCQFELDNLQGQNWMKCPTCSVFQHSAMWMETRNLLFTVRREAKEGQSYYEIVLLPTKGMWTVT